MMKPVLIALAAVLLAGEAQAISRYQTMKMSCGEVKAAVREEGAAILRWRSTRDPSLPLYGRYVASSRFCAMGEVAKYATVPTADDRTCSVNKCVPKEPHDFFRRRLFLRH